MSHTTPLQPARTVGLVGLPVGFAGIPAAIAGATATGLQEAAQ